MYCPKCAAYNTDESRFCRACGTNLTLVSQALTGQLPQPALSTELDQQDQKRLSKGIKELFSGLAFALVAKVLWFHGTGWAVWLFIPAFTMLAKGLSELIPLGIKHRKAVKATYQELAKLNQTSPAQSTKRTNELPPRPDFEQLPPPSVTETTTRHLDAAPVQRPREKQFD